MIVFCTITLRASSDCLHASQLLSHSSRLQVTIRLRHSSIFVWYPPSMKLLYKTFPTIMDDWLLF